MGELKLLSDEPIDFSLVQGGPFFQFLLRSGLLKPPTDLLLRRILVISGIAWLPVVLIALFSGRLFGGDVPLILDLGVHARFLLCIPLLILAEVVVHQRIRIVVRQFIEQGLITPEDRPRFEGIIASAMRLRNSPVAEGLIFALSITIGYSLSKRYIGLNMSSWYAIPVEGGFKLSLAGMCYIFFSLAIFRFLLTRWYFRLFVWYRFLWQVSRQIPLRLNALHPDRVGGLGFLGASAYAFQPILLAHSVALSGIIGSRIWHEGAALPQFKLELLAWLLFLMMLVIMPLCLFAVQLGAAKRAGLREYGIVASRYVSEFRRKWVEGGAGKDESLLGSSDIQSLADLAGSFEVVREMRLVPIGRTTLARMVLVTALPILPLVLTMIPLEQLIDRMLGMVI